MDRLHAVPGAFCSAAPLPLVQQYHGLSYPPLSSNILCKQPTDDCPVCVCVCVRAIPLPFGNWELVRFQVE